MAALLNDITNEINQSVAEISDTTFVNASAVDKKKSINGLASFLKTKASELMQEAKNGSDNFDLFASAIVVLAQIERQGKSTADYQRSPGRIPNQCRNHASGDHAKSNFDLRFSACR